MESFWYDTKRTPKDSPAYRKNIEAGVSDKKTISFNVNPKVRLNGTAHYVRRNLLHNGIKDNFNSSQTEYSLVENVLPVKIVETTETSKTL